MLKNLYDYLMAMLCALSSIIKASDACDNAACVRLTVCLIDMKTPNNFFVVTDVLHNFIPTSMQSVIASSHQYLS